MIIAKYFRKYFIDFFIHFSFTFVGGGSFVCFYPSSRDSPVSSSGHHGLLSRHGLQIKPNIGWPLLKVPKVIETFLNSAYHTKAEGDFLSVSTQHTHLLFLLQTLRQTT